MATFEEVRCVYCQKVLCKVEASKPLTTEIELQCGGCRAKFVMYPPNHLRVVREPKNPPKWVRPPRPGPTDFK